VSGCAQPASQLASQRVSCRATHARGKRTADSGQRDGCTGSRYFSRAPGTVRLVPRVGYCVVRTGNGCSCVVVFGLYMSSLRAYLGVVALATAVMMCCGGRVTRTPDFIFWGLPRHHGVFLSGDLLSNQARRVPGRTRKSARRARLLLLVLPSVSGFLPQAIPSRTALLLLLPWFLAVPNPPRFESSRQRGRFEDSSHLFVGCVLLAILGFPQGFRIR
jgi:hypothetical protein